MLPVLFKIGPLTIHTYGFLLAVGVLSCDDSWDQIG